MQRRNRLVNGAADQDIEPSAAETASAGSEPPPRARREYDLQTVAQPAQLVHPGAAAELARRERLAAADFDFDFGPSTITDSRRTDRRAVPGHSAHGPDPHLQADARRQRPSTVRPSADGAFSAADRMDTATRERLITAADLAPQRYPGAIGELIRQELLSWMVFGLHLGSVLIMRVADDLVAATEGSPLAAAKTADLPRASKTGRVEVLHLKQPADAAAAIANL